MATFSLLADPRCYTCDTWDLTNDQAGREYWLDLFTQTLGIILESAEQTLVTSADKLHAVLKEVEKNFKEKLATLRTHPEQLQPFTIMGLNLIQQKVLADHGLQDPFLKIKHQENVKACTHYHCLVTAHQKLDDNSLVRVLTEGIFAGNIFDLGSMATIDAFKENGLDFYRSLDNLQPRPWFVDDFDDWGAFVNSKPLKRVMIFVDNAGTDFVLGCLPLARALGKRGATVYLIANDLPCYNDITLPECRAVLRALTEDDETLGFLFRTQRIRLVGSGSGTPQLDFCNISAACNQAAQRTDLLILLGMGRALESNWNASFTCPTLKIAILKDEWIARNLGGKLFDLVCRFEQPEKI